MNPLILRLVTMSVTPFFFDSTQLAMKAKELAMEVAVTRHLIKVKRGIAEKRLRKAKELAMEDAIARHLTKVKRGIAKKRAMVANRRVIDGADAMIEVYLYKVTQAILKKRVCQANE